MDACISRTWLRGGEAPGCEDGAGEPHRAVGGGQAPQLRSLGGLSRPPPTAGMLQGPPPHPISAQATTGHPEPSELSPRTCSLSYVCGSPYPTHPPSLFPTTQPLGIQSSPLNNLSPNGLVVQT